MSIEKEKGTYDIIPDDSLVFYSVRKNIEKIFQTYGYFFCETSSIQPEELFKRTIGIASDIVTKEMFYIESDKPRFVLKPEETAPLIFSLFENRLADSKVYEKFFYFTKVYRHEKPQKGRLREFYQYGAESLGDFKKERDGEMILLAEKILNQFGIEDYELNINNIGCKNCRAGYLNLLKDYFKKNQDNLCKDCQRKIDTNTLRIFDCKNENCKKVSLNAPLITDNLCSSCKDDFEELKDFLKENDLSYNVNPYIVRGLDYYEKNVFEFVETGGNLGSQSTLIGGGRYRYKKDNVLKNDITGVGFAGGVERLILSIPENVKKDLKREESCDVYVAHMGGKTFERSLKVVYFLREKGIKTDIFYNEARINKILSLASKKNVKLVLILGEEELSEEKITLKNMETGFQKKIKLDEKILLEEIKTEISNV